MNKYYITVQYNVPVEVEVYASDENEACDLIDDGLVPIELGGGTITFESREDAMTVTAIDSDGYIDDTTTWQVDTDVHDYEEPEEEE